jgi:hypothetical protein
VTQPSAAAHARAADQWWTRAARVATATPAWLVLAVVMAVTALFLLHTTRGTTLYRDDWTWALHRRGNDVGTFLEPHYGHLSLVPLAIYRFLFATAGLEHYGPYRVVVVAGHLACVALLFVYARRRVGDLLGLLAATLLLVLGPASQNIIWAFQIGWLISLGAGVGALLMLDRRDRAGAVGACVLLAVSLASSGVGQPVALGAALEVLWRRRRQAWIVAVPLGLYAAWWLAYQTNQTGYWRHDIPLTPGWVAGAPAVVLSGLTGLAGRTRIDGPQEPLRWGIPLLVAALALLVWQRHRLWPLSPRVAALATMALSFWIVTALGRAYFGGPFAGRYLYVGAVFVLLLAAELARGVRVRPRTGAVLAALAAAAAVSNLAGFRDAARDLRDDALVVRAEVGTLELTRGIVPANYVSQGFFFHEVVAGPYFAAADALGTPAFTAAEIAAQPENVRKAADAQLVAIHRVALVADRRPATGAVAPTVVAATAASVASRGGCLRVRPAAFTPASATTQVQVAVPAGGLRVVAGEGPVAVGVRRFADETKPLGSIAPATAAALRIGPDRAPQTWILRLAPAAGATVCGR